jgi:hypothetical protein
MRTNEHQIKRRRRKIKYLPRKKSDEGTARLQRLLGNSSGSYYSPVNTRIFGSREKEVSVAFPYYLSNCAAKKPAGLDLQILRVPSSPVGRSEAVDVRGSKMATKEAPMNSNQRAVVILIMVVAAVPVLGIGWAMVTGISRAVNEIPASSGTTATSVQTSPTKSLDQLLAENRNLPTDAKWQKSRAGKLCKDHVHWTFVECTNVGAKHVWVNMSAEQLRASLGKPESIHRTVNALGTTEQWVYYEGGAYFYLTNDIVTSWQD